MGTKGKFWVGTGAAAFIIFFSALAVAPAAAKPSITIHNIVDLTGAYAPIAIPSEKGGKII